MDDGTEPQAPRRGGWKRSVFIVALAAFVGLWGFAFWYDAHRPSPEPLDARSMRAVNASCRSAVAALAGLPTVGTAPTVTSRVTRVHREDAVLTTLVSELDAIRPSDPSGDKALKSFALDWQHLIANREHYAEALLASPKRPRLEIPVDPTGAPATIRMGEYARIHKLNDCTPDSLQGEVVEGPRTYPPTT
jgi:hypothetical protein